MVHFFFGEPLRTLVFLYNASTQCIFVLFSVQTILHLAIEKVKCVTKTHLLFFGEEASRYCFCALFRIFFETIANFL